MSDKTGKDPSKEGEEFLLAYEEIKKAVTSFRNELISYLWGITDTDPRQKKIKDDVIAQHKAIDKLFLDSDAKKALYKKYMKCKSGKQKIEGWRSEFIRIDQRGPRGALPGPKSQQPMRPPTELTIIQTAAAILDYFADEQFRLHGYNIDKFIVK